IYYGFPFPNTAYAKLQTGVPAANLLKQGLEYLLDSLTADPITLSTIAVVAGACVMFRRYSLWVVIAGIVLYLVSVVRAGGDFMSGRFLAAPFVMALIAASRLDGLLTESTMALASVGIVFVGITASQPTVLSGASPIGGWVEPSGVADERRFQYPFA